MARSPPEKYSSVSTGTGWTNPAPVRARDEDPAPLEGAETLELLDGQPRAGRRVRRALETRIDPDRIERRRSRDRLDPCRRSRQAEELPSLAVERLENDLARRAHGDGGEIVVGDRSLDEILRLPEAPLQREELACAKHHQSADPRERYQPEGSRSAIDDPRTELGPAPREDNRRRGLDAVHERAARPSPRPGPRADPAAARAALAVTRPPGRRRPRRTASSSTAAPAAAPISAAPPTIRRSSEEVLGASDGPLASAPARARNERPAGCPPGPRVRPCSRGTVDLWQRGC